MKLKKAAFYSLLAVGVGLCVGGVFVPVLLPVGSACIAGAIAVAQAQQNQNNAQSNNSQNQSGNSESDNKLQDDKSDSNLEVNLHINHHHGRNYFVSRLRKLSTKPKDECNFDNKTDTQSPEKPNIHKPNHP